MAFSSALVLSASVLFLAAAGVAIFLEQKLYLGLAYLSLFFANLFFSKL